MQTLPLAITSVGDDAFVTIRQDDECGEYTMKNPEFKEARGWSGLPYFSQRCIP